MGERNRSGRRWSPLRARTREAATLAEFLRAQVDGSQLTLAELANSLAYSQAMLVRVLSGERLPPPQLVAALVRETTLDTPELEVRLAEGERLLAAAVRSHESERALGEVQRAQAALEATRHQLNRVRHQESSLEQQLEEARIRQREAEYHIGLLQGAVLQLKDELDQVRSTVESVIDREQERRQGERLGDPPGADTVQDDVGLALTRATVANDVNARVLQRIGDQLGSRTPGPPAPPTGSSTYPDTPETEPVDLDDPDFAEAVRAVHRSLEAVFGGLAHAAPRQGRPGTDHHTGDEGGRR
ncbi:hypothetical protein [Kitasatospora sp. NPDC004289]